MDECVQAVLQFFTCVLTATKAAAAVAAVEEKETFFFAFFIRLVALHIVAGYTLVASCNKCLHTNIYYLNMPHIPLTFTPPPLFSYS